MENSSTALFFLGARKFFASAPGDLGKKAAQLIGGEWAWIHIGPFSRTKRGEETVLSDIRRYKEPQLLEFVRLLDDGKVVFCDAYSQEVTLTSTIPGIREQFVRLREKQLFDVMIAFPFEEGALGEILQLDLKEAK
jgi:hypothetical protein